jgi:DNA polymerase-1
VAWNTKLLTVGFYLISARIPGMPSQLLLVDALNIFYRSFYAIADLATSAGRPTNAVYGFIKTLMQLERVWQPTHWLIVFDGGMPPERLALCPGYKAQRPPMPDALRSQFAPLETYLDSARIPRVRLENKEADDVLASAAARAEEEGFEVIVVSSDKDLMQIVDAHVAMVAPGKLVEKEGPDHVFRKTGVRPDQVVDWLALMGDSADNIPGVPGVGTKTAAKWLGLWGSLDSLWRHLDEIKPDKLRQALLDHREVVLRNARMVRLQRDINSFSSFDTLARRPPDPQRLKMFYEEMEFHSLANKLSEQTLL